MRKLTALILALVLAFGLGLSSAPAQAADVTTGTVTSLDDSGVGSLRYYIEETDYDIIDFDPALHGGTIVLGSLLDIRRDVIIQGPGPDLLTIRAGGAFGVLHVSTGWWTVSISGLTIEGGRAYRGGGIMNYGTLTVNNCIISGNSATTNGGGIWNWYGHVTVENSTISGNSATHGIGRLSIGGGICNQHGTLTVINSTISGNSARSFSGGGIYSNGTLTVESSTISGNSAGQQGGGIATSGTGTVTNSTISGNSATAGGGIYNWSTLTVTSSTFAGNTASDGGGVFNGNFGSTTVKNSIVANSPSGGNYSGGGELSVLGENLADDETLLGFTVVTPEEIKLGPLADNGGPTFTHALLDGSVAIDAAAGCNLATDQRGVPRPQGDASDIGAFEVEVTESDLTISVVGEGTTDPVPGVHTFAHGDTVTITAIPETGWVFAGWSGDVVSTDETTTVHMDSDKSITATFVWITSWVYAAQDEAVTLLQDLLDQSGPVTVEQVQEIADILEEMENTITAMLDQGAITRGEGASWLASVKAAAASIDRAMDSMEVGHLNTALNQLNALANKLNAPGRK